MKDGNHRVLRVIRTVVGLGLVLLLTYGGGYALDRIRLEGGRREGPQRLNPVLVQTYADIPTGAQPYFSCKSHQIIGEVVLVTQGGTFRVESPLRRKPPELEYALLAPLAPEGAYELFVQPTVGRGFITILQHPNGANGYTGKIKIDDPYFDEGIYHFQVWARQVS